MAKRNYRLPIHTLSIPLWIPLSIPRTCDTPIDTTETETETETDQDRKKERGGADAPTDFVFVGDVVRLTKRDFQRWREVYSAVPDLLAEIAAADAYYRDHPPKDGKWFFPVSKWLKTAHEDALAKKSPDDDTTKFWRRCIDGHHRNQAPSRR